MQGDWYCEKCDGNFNMGSRKPMITLCCFKTYCYECLIHLKYKELTVCPGCGKEKPRGMNPNMQMTQGVKPNTVMLPILSEKVGVYCHSDGRKLSSIEFYCLDCKKLQCSKCNYESNCLNHHVQIVTNSEVKEYNQHLYDYLDKEITRLKDLQQQLGKVNKNEEISMPGEYFKLMEDIREALLPRLNSIEDINSIQFLSNKFNNEEEKINIQNVEENKQDDQMNQSPVNEVNSRRWDSRFVENNSEIDNFISHCFGEMNFQLELLYRGSIHGFGALDFHTRCDQQGPTLTLIKSDQGKLFGGYTSVQWSSPESYTQKSDPNAFIFSVDTRTKFSCEYIESAVVHYKGSGPQFGNGGDICICDNSDKLPESFALLGNSFQFPNTLDYGSNEAKQYLAGSEYYLVSDIEVFKVF